MRFEIKKVLSVLAGSLLFLNARTQSEVTIHPLSVGQECPDFEFNNLVRFSKTTARLSDFKGRLIILDFWATWCAGCLEVMPGLDSLQQKYPTQLIILPVTSEKKQYIEHFLHGKNAFQRSQLPSVTGDSILGKYFKHNLIPHDIWINGDGKVIAITGSSDINDANIQLALSNNAIALPLKQDLFGLDIDKPLLLGGLGSDFQLPENQLQCSSVLTGNIQGLPSGNSTLVMKENGHVKLLALNSLLNNMFVMALTATYLANNSLPDTNDYARTRSRLILEVKDSSYFSYIIPGINKIYSPPAQKLFTYEIIRPLSDSINIASYALNDLNRYFGDLLGIEALKEKRKVKCWALTRIKNIRVPYSSGGQEEITIDTYNKRISVHNNSMKNFIISLEGKEMFNYKIPMIDETGISEPLDFELNADPADPASIGAAFHKYGLDLVLTDKELYMNIIRDRNPQKKQ